MKIKLSVDDPKLAEDPMVKRWLRMVELQINEEFARRGEIEREVISCHARQVAGLESTTYGTGLPRT